MKTDNFFSELKRRNVYKVAVTYAVVAWVLIQAASILFPTFDAPTWAMKVFVAAIILGFPIALVIAWAFETTPIGITRTETADGMPSIPGEKKRAWIVVVLVCGAISIGLFFLGRHSAVSSKSESTELLAKSIAVLPFENLSDDKANAYFATGIQDEIMTRLAKIADMKVISRTSTLQYQSKPGNLSEIAKQLGVAHVLEGSVQKAGDQVRVNVQLINAVNDAHVWAEIYDRKLTDIFGVESEIAKSIAESLQAKLTGREEQALAVKPTNNPDAYDAYLRALALEARIDPNNLPEKVISAYEQAVKLDPAFALAWARLSRLNANLYFGNYDTTAPRRDAAKRALDEAQKLQPNSPETLLALAYYQYWVLREFELAQTTLGLVTKMLPGSSEVPQALAAIARRQGHWNESITYWEQALALDPRNIELLSEAASTYVMVRQFQPALKLYDRALDIRPNDPDLMVAKAGIYQGEGNLEEAAKSLPEVDALTALWTAFSAKVDQLILERHYSEAVQLLQTRLAQYHFGFETEKGVLQLRLAYVQRLSGDSAGAKVTGEQARQILEPLAKNQPDNGLLAAVMSQVYAALGDKVAAVREAERTIAIGVSSKDAVHGPTAEENLAGINTMFGENSRAISILARLLQTPYSAGNYGTPLTPALLKLDAFWDPLRADPTFRKLYEEENR